MAVAKNFIWEVQYEGEGHERNGKFFGMFAL